MIGFIGLGVMGLHMSKRLVDSGHQLIVHDLDPKPVNTLKAMGASIGCTPSEVTSQSDVIISMLPNPMVTKEVILGEDGAIHGFHAGSILIDMSSSNPVVTKEIYQILKEREVEMLDAPVSGGMDGAKAGTLTIIVGGKKGVFEKVELILACMGKKIFHVGEIGTGHTLKLINNMLFSIIMAATAEALVFGTKAGINPITLREVVMNSSGSSYAMVNKVKDFIFPRDFNPGYAVDLQKKDLDLAIEFAKEIGTPLLLGSLIQQIYQSLISKGWGKKDTSIIISFFEEFMGSDEIRGFCGGNRTINRTSGALD